MPNAIERDALPGGQRFFRDDFREVRFVVQATQDWQRNMKRVGALGVRSYELVKQQELGFRRVAGGKLHYNRHTRCHCFSKPTMKLAKGPEGQNSRWKFEVRFGIEAAGDGTEERGMNARLLLAENGKLSSRQAVHRGT
jgi:hypothetical protein